MACCKHVGSGPWCQISAREQRDRYGKPVAHLSLLLGGSCIPASRAGATSNSNFFSVNTPPYTHSPRMKTFQWSWLRFSASVWFSLEGELNKCNGSNNQGMNILRQIPVTWAFVLEQCLIQHSTYTSIDIHTDEELPLWFFFSVTYSKRSGAPSTSFACFYKAPCTDTHSAVHHWADRLRQTQD